MKVVVWIDPDGSVEMDAPIVEVDTSDGEVRVTRRDRDGRVLSFRLWAAGRWRMVELAEPMSEDVARHRHAAALAERNTPGANRGNGFGPVGNSGPA